MKQYGDLTALNSVLGELPLMHYNGGGSVQYHTGGSGTIVVEMTSNIDKGEWVALLLTNPVDGSSSLASLATAGIRIFNFVGAASVRVRKSVGTSALFATLVLNQG